MNFVHLYKNVCSKSVWKNINSSHHVIRPFIKAPAPLVNGVNFKRLCATTKSHQSEEEDFQEYVEDPSLFGRSEDRVPPEIADRLDTEEIMKEIDEWLQEAEAISGGGLRVPYTVDMRDKIVVKTTLDVGRHTRVTAGGRIFTYSALVVIGTGNGTAGIGYGKADELPEAISKASGDAQKRMISVSRWHQKLPHTIVSEYRGTKVVMQSRAPGAGVSGHPLLQIVAQAFGLEDITCKTYRSRNARKIVAAMVHGILKNANMHPASKAKSLGRKFVSWEDYWKPPLPSAPTRVRKDWSTTSEPTDKERHDNLEALSTLPGIDIYKFAREYGIDIGYKETVLSNVRVDDSVDDSDASLLAEVEAERKLAEEEERNAIKERERLERGEEEEEEEEEAVEEEEEAVEEYVAEEEEEVQQEEATEPDFPGAYPEKPIVYKTLEERIRRETKIAPLK